MNLQDFKDIAPWTSAIIALLTLFMNSLPKFKSWCRKEQKRLRLNRFFKNYSNNNITEKLYIQNFKPSSDRVIETTNTKHILFYKKEHIILNESDDFKINEILIPKGYHIYKILSDNTIQIELINERNEYTNAYILKENNIPKKLNNPNKLVPINNNSSDVKLEIINNEEIFEKITTYI
ncbi:MAG: hypothetical protein K2X69_11865 [Silvanigrellaceae bacterium]|nr:hypothetical protein [Silvanigrellaceae bacterium]